MSEEPAGGDRPVRSATDIIDQAIRENRAAEILLYILALAVVAVGSVVLISGVISDNGVVTIAGAISNALFVPAMYFARRIRSENIAIRLLEAPLSRADTAQEAAEAIKNNFLSLSSQHPNSLPSSREERAE